jgi:hypothetical protein
MCLETAVNKENNYLNMTSLYLLRRTTHCNKNETLKGESTCHHNITTIEPIADCEIRTEFEK